MPSSSSPENFPPGILLDQELDLARGGLGGRHRERPVLLGSGDVDVGVLSRLELEIGRVHRLEPQRHDVAGHQLDRDHLGAHILHRHPAEQFVLVEVEQLDRAVAERMRPAQQHVALIDFGVVARERRVVVHLHFAVEHVGLARRAPAFPATVHQMDALPERGVEDVLVLGHLHLDVHGLEVDAVDFGHNSLLGRSRWSGLDPGGWRREPAAPPTGWSSRAGPD